jgi:hypothetical protein
MGMKNKKTKKSKEVIHEVLGHMSREAEYSRQLDPELERWHCYPSDGGHSILCVLAERVLDEDGELTVEEDEQLLGHFLPVPVKTVLKHEHHLIHTRLCGEVVVVAGLDYDSRWGLVVDSEDEEYAETPESGGVIWLKNAGARITDTNYWGSELEQRGLVFVSVNAGHIRLLIPRSTSKEVKGMKRGCRFCVLSRGPWIAAGLTLPEAVEILFEDGSNSPYALHLSPELFDVLPSAPESGKRWRLSIWTYQGRPRKIFQTTCYWRRAPMLPWLKPLAG